MKYRLKQNQPEFMAVDGPMAGRRFVHGAEYGEIPEGMSSRFEEDPPAAHARRGQKAEKPREPEHPVAARLESREKGEGDA